MTREVAAILATAALVALGISCSVPLHVELFNNSGELVVVDAHGRMTKVNPGESQEFRLGMSGGPYALLASGGRYHYKLDVRNLRELPDNCYQTAWRGLIRLQLEPDFRVFVIARGQQPPLPAPDLAQPEGFPLLPSHGPWPETQHGVADGPSTAVFN